MKGATMQRMDSPAPNLIKSLWFWRFSLACIAAGVVATIGIGIEVGVLLNWTSIYWFFPGSVILAGTSIPFGIAIGLLFGVSLYKDVLVLPNVRKHMLFYWMSWIVLGGAFALIGSIPLIVVIMLGIGISFT
jgi:hypothetical protein